MTLHYFLDLFQNLKASSHQVTKNTKLLNNNKK